MQPSRFFTDTLVGWIIGDYTKLSPWQDVNDIIINNDINNYLLPPLQHLLTDHPNGVLERLRLSWERQVVLPSVPKRKFSLHYHLYQKEKLLVRSGLNLAASANRILQLIALENTRRTFM